MDRPVLYSLFLCPSQRRCYQFETPNGWRVMEDMSEARHYAAAVLDERGDLWMLGGVNGTAAADSTEIFDFRRRRWRKGRPLPSYLR